jgi:hypothetical protein
MKTPTQKLLDEISRAGNIATRRGGVWYEPEWDEKRGLWIGFFENHDEERSDFCFELRRLGFKEVYYKVRYHWKLKKKHIGVEYVEGDIYITSDHKPCDVCGDTGEVTTDEWDDDSKNYQPTGSRPCPKCKLVISEPADFSGATPGDR